jgi:Gamma tubulin complex component C-terminal
MSPISNFGPRAERAYNICATVSANCRIIRRSPESKPVSRAVSRAIFDCAVHPFHVACATALGGREHPGFQSNVDNWLDLAPILCELTSAAMPSCALSHSIISRIAADFHRVQLCSHAERVLLSVWHDTFSIYSRPLSVWLNTGSLHDVTGEFFIVASDSTPPLAPPSPFRRASDPFNNAPQNITYSVNRDRLPSFISPAVADRVLFAGQVVKCFYAMLNISRDADAGHDEAAKRLSAAATKAASVAEFASADLIDRMVSSGRSIELVFEAASVIWHDHAAARLTALMPAGHVDTHLSALRGFLLLGNELFWRLFFTRLRAARHMLHVNMKDADVEAANRALEHIIDSCVADDSDPLPSRCSDASGHKAQQPCILRLTTTGDGALMPSFDIPFPASAVVGDTSAMYRQVFSVAFGVRRVVLELEQCYAGIASTWRLRHQQAFSEGKDRAEVGLEEEVLRKCSLLRMRMTGFMQAFDDYLQIDVFESGFKTVMAAVAKMEDIDGRGVITDGDDRSLFPRICPSALSARTGFSDVVAAHTAAMDGWLTHSLASTDAIQRRLDGVCSACLRLCEISEDAICGRLPLALALVAGCRIEAAYMQNASLLVRVVSSVQGRLGTSLIGVLLSRVDAGGFYRDEGAGMELVF